MATLAHLDARLGQPPAPVLAIAYAWVLTLGSLVYTDPALQQRVTKGHRPTYSLFRLGLRLWESLRGQVSALLSPLPPGSLSLESVRA